MELAHFNLYISTINGGVKGCNGLPSRNDTPERVGGGEGCWQSSVAGYGGSAFNRRLMGIKTREVQGAAKLIYDQKHSELRLLKMLIGFLLLAKQH